jgi:dihydroorotase
MSMGTVSQEAVLLRGGRALHLDGFPSGQPVDIGIDADGRVSFAGAWDGRPFERIVDLQGAWLSPAWIDLHVHCYYGGTRLSLRPDLLGPSRGVGLVVDCGSAGQANFAGLREFIIGPAPFPILAFLNISLIGLVAANRVSELIGDPVLDPERTAECVEANREVIKGIKIRASSIVVREWGMAPVRVAKRVAVATGLPLVVHIGEAPPTLHEILDILDPGDVITHCFTGRLTAGIHRQPSHFERFKAMQQNGLLLDVDHGQGSFNYEAARFAVDRGLLPDTISTDLHIGNVWGPCWDLATTMSKCAAVGMTEGDVVERVTRRPAKFLGLDTEWGSLRLGAPARFTSFHLSDRPETLPDSDGNLRAIPRFFDPVLTVLGSAVVPASRNTIRDRRSESI